MAAVQPQHMPSGVYGTADIQKIGIADIPAVTGGYAGYFFCGMKNGGIGFRDAEIIGNQNVIMRNPLLQAETADFVPLVAGRPVGDDAESNLTLMEVAEELLHFREKTQVMLPVFIDRLE